VPNIWPYSSSLPSTPPPGLLDRSLVQI
jgi:hypothetical protein